MKKIDSTTTNVFKLKTSSEEKTVTNGKDFFHLAFGFVAFYALGSVVVLFCALPWLFLWMLFR